MKNKKPMLRTGLIKFLIFENRERVIGHSGKTINTFTEGEKSIQVASRLHHPKTMKKSLKSSGRRKVRPKHFVLNRTILPG